MATATQQNGTVAKPKSLEEMSKDELLATVIEQTKAQVEFIPEGEKDPIKINPSIVRKLIARPTRSGAMPSERDILNFIMLCKARRLNPFTGDAFLVGYDSKDGPAFNLITAHQAVLKRAEAHDEFDGMKGGIIVLDAQKNVVHRDGAVRLPGDILHGAWARVWRKDRKHETEVEIEIGARTGRSPLWQSDPCGMIVKCAKSAGLREAFPSTLSGMYTEEEHDLMQRTQQQLEQTARSTSIAERLAPKEPAHDELPAEVDEGCQDSPEDEFQGGYEPEESEVEA